MTKMLLLLDLWTIAYALSDVCHFQIENYKETNKRGNLAGTLRHMLKFGGEICVAVKWL